VRPKLALLVTSPRVAPGLLSAQAWAALRAGPVISADAAAPAAVALANAGLDLRLLTAGSDLDRSVDQLLSTTRSAGAATWLVGPDGDEELVARLIVAADQSFGGPAEVEVVTVLGSWDLPGARLLDVVATMDRLRSPEGCPWDAEQDHTTLAPYLLEEAYEAFQTIEDGDLTALRDELGDVLLQIVFHARLAEELPEAQRWSVDDVATGLVEKLVRRHPHVFDDVVVSGSTEVNVNWEAIKKTERGKASVVASVPLSAPALTLAATLQRKATRAGLTVEPPSNDGLAGAAARFDADPSGATAGELLWEAVAAMQALGIDSEAALRARSRTFRDQVAALDQPNG
jgi:XTP/dITP diphosphohydrolase